MKKLYYAATTYAGLGLVSGLAYREITKAHDDFEGKTQLAFMHTHLLALGMLFFLIVLVLEKVFELSRHSLFNAFFWTYNVGLVVTVAMMGWHGYLQVDGTKEADVSPAISGIAGLGHILLTVGIVCLFIALGAAIRPSVPGVPADQESSDR